MDNSVSPNRTLLIAMGVVAVVLVGLVIALIARRNSDAAVPANPAALAMPAGATGQTNSLGHATGYKNAELMPAPPGAAGGSAAPAIPAPESLGHATGYKGAELMPAPPGGAQGATSSGAAGGGALGHATGYQNSNLMPAPPASR